MIAYNKLIKAVANYLNGACMAVTLIRDLVEGAYTVGTTG